MAYYNSCCARTSRALANGAPERLADDLLIDDIRRCPTRFRNAGREAITGARPPRTVDFCKIHVPSRPVCNTMEGDS
jgi:hypothetical protein